MSERGPCDGHFETGPDRFPINVRLRMSRARRHKLAVLGHPVGSGPLFVCKPLKTHFDTENVSCTPLKTHFEVENVSSASPTCDPDTGSLATSSHPKTHFDSEN
eukprot:7327836-Karenia_brevis.AAC.1